MKVSKRARKRHLRNIRRQQKKLHYKKVHEEFIKKTISYIEKEKMFDIFSEIKISDDSDTKKNTYI